MSAEGVWVPLLCSKPRTVSGRGVFQDDVFVSGLKDGTQPVVGDYARFAWPPAEATKSRLGYGQPFSGAEKLTLPRLAKVHSVPEFQECAFEHYQKARGMLGWSLIGASRLVCRIQRRTISIRNPKDVLVTKAL